MGKGVRGLSKGMGMVTEGVRGEVRGGVVQMYWRGLESGRCRVWGGGVGE